MPKARTRTILQRQLDIRGKLWPEQDPRGLWAMDKDGWVAMPRLMPLMMSIMDDLSGKGFPVSRAYLELWSRVRVEEAFIALNRPDEMAFHAGFEGQRALRTWKDRMLRLAALGFIDLKSGPLGELSYALILNPYHVIKRAHLAGQVQANKWQALIVRANEISAFDIDDLDAGGTFIEDDDDDVAGEAVSETEGKPPPADPPVGKRSRRHARSRKDAE